MTAVSKLDEIVDKYSKTYHRTIRIKPAGVKSGTYIRYGVEHNDKDPKFKVGNHVRISKYRNIFTNSYIPNWSKEVFVIKKLENTVPGTYIISGINGEEIIGTFFEKYLQKTS